MFKKLLVVVCAASVATSAVNANEESATVAAVEQRQQDLIQQGQEIVRQLRARGLSDEQIAQTLIEAAENGVLGLSSSEKVSHVLLGAAGSLAAVATGVLIYRYVKKAPAQTSNQNNQADENQVQENS